MRGEAATHWPERVERVTGVPQAAIEEAAHRLGRARSAMILTARGPEQQSRGVANVLAYVNVALALGLPGRDASGFGTLTGQGNGQGGREHGQKTDQLPGYRRIDDPAARAHLARVWDVAEDAIPVAGASAYEMLDRLGEHGGVRTLLVFGTNPAVSAPRAFHVQERLCRLDDARRRGLLPVRDGGARGRGAARRAVGRGGRHHDQPRGPGGAPPPGGASTRGRAHRRRDPVRAGGRAGRGAPLPFRRRRRGLRGAARGDARAASPTTRASRYDRIDREGGVFWPCPSEDHPGTPRLFAERFPTPSGRARFHAVRPRDAAEEPDAEFPLYLTTGRRARALPVGHADAARGRTSTARHRTRSREVHPLLARRHGLAEGDLVRIATRRGWARVPRAARRRASATDTVFVPFHWGGARLGQPPHQPGARPRRAGCPNSRSARPASRARRPQRAEV